MLNEKFRAGGGALLILYPAIGNIQSKAVNCNYTTRKDPIQREKCTLPKGGGQLTVKKNSIPRHDPRTIPVAEFVRGEKRSERVFARRGGLIKKRIYIGGGGKRARETGRGVGLKTTSISRSVDVARGQKSQNVKGKREMGPRKTEKTLPTLLGGGHRRRDR